MWQHFLEFELFFPFNSLSILADSQKPIYPISSYEYPPKAPLIWQYDILLSFLLLWTPLLFQSLVWPFQGQSVMSVRFYPGYVHVCFLAQMLSCPCIYIYLQSDMKITLQCLLKIFLKNQKLSTRKKSWRFQCLY